MGHSVHVCLDCGTRVSTESTVAGPFEAPPTLNCLECGLEMDVTVA